MTMNDKEFSLMIDGLRKDWHELEENLKNEVYAAELRASGNNRVSTIKLHYKTKKALGTLAAYPNESYESIIIRRLIQADA
jgi:hypothetical protein